MGLPPDAYLIGASAAKMHELWLPDHLREDATISVATPPGTRRRGGHHVRGVQRAAGICEVVRRRSIAVCSPADTWAEITGLTLEERVMLGDHLTRREDPWCDVEALAAAVRRRAGRPGSRSLSTALALVRAGTDSVMETRLRLLVGRWGLPEPTINLSVVDREGQFLARVDLGYEEYRVALEYDGGQHRTEDRQFRRDIDRVDRLIDHGWRVIRVGAHHFTAGEAGLRARVERALRDRGWSPDAGAAEVPLPQVG